MSRRGISTGGSGSKTELDLARLSSASKAELLALWHAHFPRRRGKVPPRQLMIRELAWQAQVGRLDALTNRLLNAAVRQAMKSVGLTTVPGDSGATEGTAPAPTVRSPKRPTIPHTPPVLPAASTLIHHWRGRTYEVTVVEGGARFLFQGRTYKSLSAIATEITGCSWSGPRFFGLVGRAKPQGVNR